MGKLHGLPSGAARSALVLLRQHLRGQDIDPSSLAAVPVVLREHHGDGVSCGGYSDEGLRVVVAGHLDGVCAQCCGKHGCCSIGIGLHLVLEHSFTEYGASSVRSLLDQGYSVLLGVERVDGGDWLYAQGLLPL